MQVLLAVIALLGFIGTSPQFWGSSWKDIYHYKIKGSVPWDMVHQASLNLIARMREEGFSPTVVAGIGRGGIIAGGLIASEIIRHKISTDQRTSNSILTLPKLRIASINTNVVFKPLGSVASSDSYNRVSIDRIDVSEGDCTLLHDDKVLLLVAQNFTGATLEKTIAFVLAKGLPRENVKTATLFWQKPKGMDPNHIADAHQPDIFGMVIASSKTMPWKSKNASTDRM